MRNRFHVLRIRLVNPLPPPQTDVTLTVAAVARRLGVAPATLRTWDRRYGLGPSGHSAGGHRRYSVLDMARLESMQRLVKSGVSPADAARVALELTEVSITAPGAVISPIDNSNLDAVQLVRGLLRAATSLDSVALSDSLDSYISRYGVVWTWMNVLSPVLVEVGNRWETEKNSIEVEHLLSECSTVAFAKVINELKETVNVRPVLLACAPDELHSLPLMATAAALAERRITSRSLGARVPVESLVAAMQRIGPSAIVVWSQTSGISDLARLAGLPMQRPKAAIYAAGPGWKGPMPDGVTYLESLEHAIDELTEVAI